MSGVTSIKAASLAIAKSNPVQKSGVQFADALKKAKENFQQNSKIGEAIKSCITRYDKGTRDFGSIVNDVLKSDNLSIRHMLLLQAKTHQISFELTTGAKVIETSSNSVKATLQTQV